jgi:hypothetical protein
VRASSAIEILIKSENNKTDFLILGAQKAYCSYLLMAFKGSSIPMHAPRRRLLLFFIWSEEEKNLIRLEAAGIQRGGWMEREERVP